MTRIGVRELRQNASRYLALVKAGETVEVTSRGELVAVLAPPTPSHRDRDRLIAAGVLVPAAGRTGRLRDAHPVQAPPGTPSNAELLERQRAEPT